MPYCYETQCIEMKPRFQTSISVYESHFYLKGRRLCGLCARLAQRPRCLAVILALAASALAQSSAADAQSVTVCASGCNYTTIAGALASAVSGETINILDAVH